MTENEIIEASKRKHIRQPPFVPFLWEERPGIAKKDWKPVVSSVTTLALPPPVKLIASVPFNWEEKPGKPLPCFSQPPMESPPATLNSLPSPPMYYQRCDDCEFNNENRAGHDNYGEKEEGIFDLDIESFSFETDDSLSSAPSLLANCLVSSVAVSDAVPVDHLETPSSPASDTDSSTSSYATGISSLTGASLLECLFPLYAPDSGFLETVAHSTKGSLIATEVQNCNSNRASDNIVTTKRTPTLGELIMMSRRRSCQRKAIQMGNRNLPMEFMNSKSFGCCIFGTGITMIEWWQRKRHHARLKLI
eukprot:XP_002510900.2 uncharacterized protein LOC8266021 isoform X1 [Ricinus communis]